MSHEAEVDGGCLPDLLRKQVEEHPDRTAVVFGEQSITYGELFEQSSALATHLRRLGISEDDCVGMFVEPSLDLVVGAWGILCGGGAYLPLSPEYPEERLRYMIEDSRTKVVVTQPALKQRLAELAPSTTRIVTLDDCDEAFDDGFSPAHDSLAYIIYTSGSTGRPKGVMIEHRSIVNQMLWLHDTHAIDGTKRVVQKTPMSFDAAQWEILAPAVGSTVVMGRPGIYRDPEMLIDTMREHGVTTLQCVPTLLQALIDTEEFHTVTSLKQVFSGGEALSRTLAQAFVADMPNVRLINLYGPTETTINSSSHVVDPAELAEAPKSISIGLPVANTTYLVLNDNRDMVTPGEIGELYIGGVQVARGYLHQPELTEERFVDGMFRTGDLVTQNLDGTVQFAGRADSQVKLRGYRVELDEIRLAIETHDWVRNAAVIVKEDERTGFQNLIACVELNPKEAALMDQGNAGSHHQSKSSRLQVRAQLSNPGVRDDLSERQSFELPGEEASCLQRKVVFSRKSYRFYEGGQVTDADLRRLLERKPIGAGSKDPKAIHFAELGEILRYFGAHFSDQRLLPKYGYASPGSLYATQLHLELHHIAGLPSGLYYYHPLRHQLVLITSLPESFEAQAKLHFIGRKAAIESVYLNNILEVLEIETGHMVGLFEEVLPGYGLDVTASAYTPETKDLLDVSDEDYYLGTFELCAYTGVREDDVDVYVQTHPGRVTNLPGGQYRYADGEFERVSDELVLRKHVIAINQAVYERASFGISAIGRSAELWRRYIDLGRTMHRLSANDVDLGFMSSGYSSKTNNDLPSAKRICDVLKAAGEKDGPSYFFLGGKVSYDQRRSPGMKEDVVHMKGPAELIRDDLVNFLPDYMIPNKVVVLDALPVTANGKIDVKALEKSDKTNVDDQDRPFVAPRTITERRISEMWKKLMKRETVSTHDDFFETGGNSLIAVGLVNRINKDFGTSLPLQVLFESPTIEQLSRRVDGLHEGPISRLVPLQPNGDAVPVFCWPGLGGYPMNLRTLASRSERPFYGVQAHGINEGEAPYSTIREMAAADIEAIKEVQPEGPYTLWGYSFGARVAFETAYQLEQAGEEVANLYLIAPGSPKVRSERDSDEASYDNSAFVTILFSVFAGSITDARLDRCLEVAKDEDSFAAFVSGEFRDLDSELVRRIIKIVTETFSFKYTFSELAERTITAPLTIFKAQGDDYSFIEGSEGFSVTEPVIVELKADHYSLLREPDIDELLASMRRRDTVRQEAERLPVLLSDEQMAELIAAVTKAVTLAITGGQS
ncbi:amino acid adenylation domain-containing protein [Lentzea waywayandensis]|uniref:Amino acid adenylation domain-containing protein n=1 Tax=Lentzea waywayandensis TaxID=84724 RepID=A0A1I6EX64_9PSEU|nr:amino acid adenylation domain-containing protein [Lentzea waywayandensis]SFR22299.1 amino acid adenylation domain-containing protein [Lentzea waywayandensis]